MVATTQTFREPLTMILLSILGVIGLLVILLILD